MTRDERRSGTGHLSGVLSRAVRHGAALLVVSMALLQRAASAQLPVPSLRLALGFGVDTTGSPAHEVFELWRHYLEEPSDSARIIRCA